ncbi:hypothetical protein DVH24_029160 [Malus domestica]|uniref:Uncharacterized protein n=1 Tax=Malus domestica TaxID=3750 RepID=A0A498HUW5_MALDO|nr:hypothetical protein DVH24_029160 [Malus domestica]
MSDITCTYCPSVKRSKAAGWFRSTEADSFSCFVRLLSGSVDHFCELDISAVCILCALSRLSELLKPNGEELWKHLEFNTSLQNGLIMSIGGVGLI